MLAIIQRINGGEVVVEGNTVAKCEGLGLLVLLGVTHEDTEEDARLLGDKIAKLRIFSDENDKMNLSVLDVDGVLSWCLTSPCTVHTARETVRIT